MGGNMFVTRSLAMTQSKNGALIGVKGTFIGAMFRFYSEKEVMVGRDGTQSELVVDAPKISRKHLTINYSSKNDNYAICDISSNGTFLLNGERLPRGRVVVLKPGDCICLGDMDEVFRLG